MHPTIRDYEQARTILVTLINRVHEKDGTEPSSGRAVIRAALKRGLAHRALERAARWVQYERMKAEHELGLKTAAQQLMEWEG